MVDQVAESQWYQVQVLCRPTCNKVVCNLYNENDLTTGFSRKAYSLHIFCDFKHLNRQKINCARGEILVKYKAE